MSNGTVTNPLTTRIVPGGPLRDAVLAQIATAIEHLPATPVLRIVQVGDNPASNAYVRNKLLACAKVGIDADVVRLREDEGEAALHTVLRGLAHEGTVHAMLLQTPLPHGWNVQGALDLIPWQKDVDGLTSDNMLRRRSGQHPALLPATPLGIMRLLDFLGLEVRGARVAVIGKGMVVGAPLREILRAAGADVLAIDKDTPHPMRLCREADVIVAAAGVPGLVTTEWVKPGAIVLDVGLTRVDGHLLGDVDRMAVEGVAGVLTPVPGGIGPLTVASLLTNVVDATCLQVDRPWPQWRLDGGGAVAHL